jgi:hypothetical protein
MQILLAFIAGAVIGIGVHFHVGARTTRGQALAPMIGAVSAGAAWAALTWAGVGIDTPWPWFAAVVVPTAVTYPAIIVLARLRTRRDAAERERLGIG